MADRMHFSTPNHYENFPVASIFLPQYLRVSISMIYSFARQADDFADEGDFTVDERLERLNAFNDALELLKAYIKPSSDFFITLGEVIKSHQLPFDPFFDLLAAFKQDVIKTRYVDYDEVLDYCRRSANPIGRLLLHLYQAHDAKHLRYSDDICTALQLINFLQDVAIDFKKNDGQHRIYLCQEEMSAFGITEHYLNNLVNGSQMIDDNWSQFMAFNLHRAKALLYAGKPLGRILKGRVGFEMRMIIAGGERMIDKILAVDGDVFNQRPTLKKWDWIVILFKAFIKGESN